MTESEFKERFEREKHIYESWGNYVRSHIIEVLSREVNIDVFLKVNSIPRVKDTNSLISKAFYRGKNYSDPYNQITDKVGMRFVVLLIEDINKIRNIIQANTFWTYSEDRNFEGERVENPDVFTYQSVHYVITSREKFNFKGTEIPEGVTCEVQIRTLLQHAYSELTHDTVYKPKTKAEPMVHRLVARSMALIEATDELFGEVNKMISSQDNIFEDLMCRLEKIYSTFAVPDYDKGLSMYIFDAYSEIIKVVEIGDILAFIENKQIIKQIITRNYEKNLLYKQPIILLLYYLISTRRNKTLDLWPLTIEEITPLYTDLGFSIPD